MSRICLRPYSDTANPRRSPSEQVFPGNEAIERLHSFQKPDLKAGGIAPLQRCGVDSHKALDSVGVELAIGLRHISAHGLADEDGMFDALRAENFLQPARFIHQAEVELKGPGGGMARRVPDQHVVPALKIPDLPLKQPVIGRQPWQEYQRKAVADDVFGKPEMNLAVCGAMDAFPHKRHLHHAQRPGVPFFPARRAFPCYP